MGKKAIIIVGGRSMGKAVAMHMAQIEYLKRHPKATIMRGNGIVEKYIGTNKPIKKEQG